MTAPGRAPWSVLVVSALTAAAVPVVIVLSHGESGVRWAMFAVLALCAAAVVVASMTTRPSVRGIALAGLVGVLILVVAVTGWLAVGVSESL